MPHMKPLVWSFLYIYFMVFLTMTIVLTFSFFYWVGNLKVLPLSFSFSGLKW